MIETINNTYQDFYTSTTAQRKKEEAEKIESGKVSHQDFIKLLTTQLTTQDPLNPMEDIDFTAQLAQLQALDEQVAMTKSMAAMRLDSQLQAGSNMIGKYVSGVDKNGTAATGLVSRVVQSDSSVYLELENRQQLEVSSVSNLWNDSKSMGQDIMNSGSLIGMWVEAGYDSAMQPIRGIIEKVLIANGTVSMKLYGGQTVTWDQIKELRTPSDDELWYTLPDEVRNNVDLAKTMVNKIVSGTTDDGRAVTGMVGNAELSGNDVYLVLYNGDKVKITSVNSETVRDPSASDLAAALNNYYVTGLDAEANTISGIVVGAEDHADGVALILADGREVYWDTLSEIREATEDELAAAGDAGESAADGDAA
jgi:flagellar basal-body rod modification protein FlgD